MQKFFQFLFDKTLWEWIAKNRATFIIIILLAGNVYQYVDNTQREKRYEVSLKEANDKLSESNKNSLSYERNRSDVLSEILNTLIIKYNNLDSTKNSQRK